MIERAYRLRRVLDYFFRHERGTYELKIRPVEKSTIGSRPEDSSTRFVFEHQLTAKDWQQVEEILEVLALFREATLKLEGRPDEQKEEPPIMLVSLILNSTMDALEKLKTHTLRTYGNKGIYIGVEQAWNKAHKYYNSTTESPLYAAAMILNPRWKVAGCVELWGNTHAVDQLAKVRRFFKDNYGSLPTVAREPLSPIKLPNPTQQSRYGSFNSAIDRLGKRSTTLAPMRTVDDEITAYLQEDYTGSSHPSEYWRLPIVQLRYPRLSRMAIDVYATPAMSDEPERVFSLGGNTVTAHRASLIEDTQEALVCLSYWISNLNMELELPGTIEQSSHASSSQGSLMGDFDVTSYHPFSQLEGN